MGCMPSPRRAPSTEQERYQEAVAAYVAAGGEESVQRVITALHSVTRKLDRWYTRQLADLDLSSGEFGVITQLATADHCRLTPSVLADSLGVAASSMTHRLDRMTERGLVARATDPANRTRVLVSLTADGWALFEAATKEANVVESDTLSGLSPAQRVELATLLEIVIDGLDEQALA